jgi:hypothetical protein
MAVTRTFNTGNTVITLGSLDADYNYSTDFAAFSKGIRVHSIQFVPTDKKLDVCQLKDGSATGPVIFHNASLCNFETKYYGGARLKPYYDISDTNKCTASANAKIIIILGGYLD